MSALDGVDGTMIRCPEPRTSRAGFELIPGIRPQLSSSARRRVSSEFVSPCPSEMLRI